MPSGSPLATPTSLSPSIGLGVREKQGAWKGMGSWEDCSSCKKGSKVGGKGFPHPTCSGGLSRLQALLEYRQPL